VFFFILSCNYFTNSENNQKKMTTISVEQKLL